MDNWDFLKWRRTLRYKQTEVAERLGVNRTTIKNWERGVTRIPVAAELACVELSRQWKQRPEFGPVKLIYADTSLSQQPDDDASLTSYLRCELYPNNERAISRALQLSQTGDLIDPLIMERDGNLVWTAYELIRECERRKVEGKQWDGTPEARGGPLAGQAASTGPAPDKNDAAITKRTELQTRLS